MRMGSGSYHQLNRSEYDQRDRIIGQTWDVRQVLKKVLLVFIHFYENYY